MSKLTGESLKQPI